MGCFRLLWAPPKHGGTPYPTTEAWALLQTDRSVEERRYRIDNNRFLVGHPQSVIPCVNRAFLFRQFRIEIGNNRFLIVSLPTHISRDYKDYHDETDSIEHLAQSQSHRLWWSSKLNQGYFVDEHQRWTRLVCCPQTAPTHRKRPCTVAESEEKECWQSYWWWA